MQIRRNADAEKGRQLRPQVGIASHAEAFGPLQSVFITRNLTYRVRLHPTLALSSQSNKRRGTYAV